MSEVEKNPEETGETQAQETATGKAANPAPVKGYKPKTWFNAEGGPQGSMKKVMTSSAKKTRKSKKKMAKKSRSTNKRK